MSNRQLPPRDKKGRFIKAIATPNRPSSAPPVAFGVGSPTAAPASPTWHSRSGPLFSLYPAVDLLDSAPNRNATRALKGYTPTKSKMSSAALTIDDLAKLIVESQKEIRAVNARVTQMSATGGSSLTAPVTGTTSKAELEAKLTKRLDNLQNGNLTVKEVETLFKAESAPGAAPISFPPKEERLKGEEVGWLDPASPEKFIETINAVAKLYGDGPVLKAIHKSMVANNNQIVTDWYSTLGRSSEVNRLAMENIPGWSALIRQKFGKTTMEKIKDLDSLKFSWDEPVSTLVTKVQRACIKARMVDDATQVYYIFKKLPAEFRLGLNPDSFKTPEALELELRGREDGA